MCSIYSGDTCRLSLNIQIAVQCDNVTEMIHRDIEVLESQKNTGNMSETASEDLISSHVNMTVQKQQFSY